MSIMQPRCKCMGFFQPPDCPIHGIKIREKEPVEKTKRGFQVRISKGEYYDNSIYTIEITDDGYEWNRLGLRKPEVEELVKELKRYFNID